jgi:hypothetical protein
VLAVKRVLTGRTRPGRFGLRVRIEDYLIITQMEKENKDRGDAHGKMCMQAKRTELMPMD